LFLLGDGSLGNRQLFDAQKALSIWGKIFSTDCGHVASSTEAWTWLGDADQQLINITHIQPEEKWALATLPYSCRLGDPSLCSLSANSTRSFDAA
jgi:hypothetical protein